MDIHLWVKRQFLSLFNEGKDLEIRVNCGIANRITVGDCLVLNNVLRRRVTAIRYYRNFEHMLSVEDHRRIHPRLTRAELLAGLRLITEENPEYWGVVVFELVT